MTIHKLTAGSGYDYLTRQVAALDGTDKGHTGLATYYTERGETPGVWIGSGMEGIDGLNAGDVVTAEQMQSLFGSGHHPLAVEREAAAGSLFSEPLDTRLGAPYKVYSGDVSSFREEVAQRIEGSNRAKGFPADWAVPLEERARIRTQVAAEYFQAQHGRAPVDARELASAIARLSRPKTTAVAGYDLTFSPVKSVSALWAIADTATSARIERAHQAAIKDALTFIEDHALYTRTGANGVQQVDVQGLVATAFTHRDSRAGDPDLHTHVAVANKVKTEDGKWLSIDGRSLFKATVAASETYNTALEKHLRADLGVQFHERTEQEPGRSTKRQVREIVGVDPALNERWSARRASIQARQGELAHQFQADHGRPPTPVEAYQLAQKATLETRDAKHSPRTITEQRAAWAGEATEVLGGQEQVEQMVTRALNPPQVAATTVDPDWVASTSSQVVEELESRRSLWQTWHVRAEAQRQARAANIDVGSIDDAVDQVVRAVLDERSVPLRKPTIGVEEPDQLRRKDGSSVYEVAGAVQHTSARIIDAERRLVDRAGQTDGHTVPTSAADLALLASTANGTTLNPAQAHMVRQVVTSPARIQVAIAPAGTGKTTTMRVLAAAWHEGGGHTLGLAPSAAAADALRESASITTDTLAKLTWSIEHDDLPDWAAKIGPETLVIIDEAGMADTLSLDTATQFITDRGGRVCLIGDDQQLGAIGAGGVLRDIKNAHGALQISQLMRFTDPSEAAATLALREGRPEALGFYLDAGRVHVGSQEDLAEAVFDAWRSDQDQGRDAIMLAPTRELVAHLNAQARSHRLESEPDAPAAHIQLSDGNHASAGDLIITRRNDRTLRTSATDWVKNGDRWTVLEVHRDGSMTAQHTESARVVALPAAYVAGSVELGYAVTTHAAQGVSVDTMHGLVSGGETRQHLYTMMTRGRLANHAYLEVVGDGDPHSVITPDVIHPPTSTDVLERILARDGVHVSALTTQRELTDPHLRLGEATAQYLDALYTAASAVLGAEKVATLDEGADNTLPGLTAEPAWPTLRAHLLLIAAHGRDPLQALRSAADTADLDDALDQAAVLGWRLDDTGMRSTSAGPLPWTPGIPAQIRNDPAWGAYLAARAEHVTTLAGQITGQSLAQPQSQRPDWARNLGDLTPTLWAQLQVWRAAHDVPGDDQHPTGAKQYAVAPARWQRKLEEHLTIDDPAAAEWSDLLHHLSPSTKTDPFTTQLASRLSAVSRSGIDTHQLVRQAAAKGPLPDDHAAAALWWRISGHLSPAVLREATSDIQTIWSEQVGTAFPPGTAERIQSDELWPALVATLDQATRRGWSTHDLVDQLTSSDATNGVQEMVWRISVLLDPPSEHDSDHGDHDGEPDEPWWIPPAEGGTQVDHDGAPVDNWEPAEREPSDDDTDVDLELMIEGSRRGDSLDLPPTGAALNQAYEQHMQWSETTVTRERLISVNDLTTRYYQAQLEHGQSWARGYLTDRFGLDLVGDERVRAGYAPQGWTNLVEHLRDHGVSYQEMLESGVATRARTGRLIDRFRDRLTFPITDHAGTVVGFVGRRNPARTDSDNAGPKYLNTADTLLYRKAATVFAPGASTSALEVPVLVEGPMDAIAITLATDGHYRGHATLGTSLTEEQAQLITGQTMMRPIVAMDGDTAGQVAAQRAYWMLSMHGSDPLTAPLPADTDPAQLLHTQGPQRLAELLTSATPLADSLINERRTHLHPSLVAKASLPVIAVQPAPHWAHSIEKLAEQLPGVQPSDLRAQLLPLVKDWNSDPRQAAQRQVDGIGQVRDRIQKAAQQAPEDRWEKTVATLQPTITSDPQWPTLASTMDQAFKDGHNVSRLVKEVTRARKLSEKAPAEDLHLRVKARIAGARAATVSGTDPTVGEPRSGPVKPRPVQERPGHPQAADHAAPPPG